MAGGDLLEDRGDRVRFDTVIGAFVQSARAGRWLVAGIDEESIAVTAQQRAYLAGAVAAATRLANS